MNVDFEFKQLQVWQESVGFAGEILKITSKIGESRKHYRMIEQTESAVISISMNIAEGKGRISRKEYIQFLAFARGSLYEVVTLLVIMANAKLVTQEEHQAMEEKALKIGRMLNALIRAIRNQIPKT